MAIEANFLSALKASSVRKIEIRSTETGAYVPRRSSQPSMSKKVRLMLVEASDGTLDWEEGSLVIPGLSHRKRGTGATTATSQVSFERLPPSQLTDFLIAQDQFFTPERGLRRYRRHGGLVNDRFPKSGSVLLLIHGTFSSGSNFVKSLESTLHGRQFLQDAWQRYAGNIFVFDHPTISVNPLLNALDLEQWMRSSKATIDILAHSRGGLVSRWWCEMYDPTGKRCRNAIMVGSPLAGTGLAAPPNIRRTLKLLTNYGHALSAVSQWASLATPIMGLVHTLLQVITGFTSIAANTPIVDALMAMIPGLFGQARVGNNPELLRLHAFPAQAHRYASVVTDFASARPGWQFWEHFAPSNLADRATDQIFRGPNDLVVDTPSMTYLTASHSIRSDRTLNFGISDTIHHLNYFDDPRTIDFLRKILRLRSS